MHCCKHSCKQELSNASTSTGRAGVQEHRLKHGFQQFWNQHRLKQGSEQGFQQLRRNCKHKQELKQLELRDRHE